MFRCCKESEDGGKRALNKKIAVFLGFLANMWFNMLCLLFFSISFEYVVFIMNLPLKFRDNLFCSLRDMMF